jgi:hypothetical protein
MGNGMSEAHTTYLVFAVIIAAMLMISAVILY